MKAEKCLFVFSICLLAGCANLEKKLQNLPRTPESALAVKDTKGAYWGFPGSTIEQVNGKKLSLKVGGPVRYCATAEGSAGDIGRALIGDTTGTPVLEGSKTTWKTESSYGRLPIQAGPDNSIQTNGFGVTGVAGQGETQYKLSGCVPGEIAKRIEIEVLEILLSSGDK